NLTGTFKDLSTTNLNTPMAIVTNFPPGSDFVDVANPTNPYSTTPVPAQGFYVLGPDPPTNPKNPNPSNKAFLLDKNNVNRDPQLPVSAKFPQLSSQLAAAPDTITQTYAVFLQRLANPNMPFHVTTNPYITVDYVTNLSSDPTSPMYAVHNGVVYDTKGLAP